MPDRAQLRTTEMRALDDAQIAHYRGLSPEDRPPILVVEVPDGTPVCMDGNHRVCAALMNGEKQLLGLVKK